MSNLPSKGDQPAPVRKKVKKKKKQASLKPFLAFVVAAVLAIGVGYMAQSFFSHKGKPVQTMSKEDKKTFTELASMLEDYRETFEKYPENFQELLDLEWIEAMPIDMNKRPLNYKTGNNGKSYEIRSSGTDAKLQTADDICLKTISKNEIPFRFYTCQSTSEQTEAAPASH